METPGFGGKPTLTKGRNPAATHNAIDNHSQLDHISTVSPGSVPMIVCVCNRLNETRIRSAIEAGAPTPEAVYSGCGVKRNCGRCQETIAEMLDEHRQTR